MHEPSFERVETVFHAALGRQGDDRSAFLDEACGSDVELRRAVERLLAADARAESRIGSFQPFGQQIADPHLGRTLGPWHLVERIATGGMGVVYRGTRTDGMFEQTVAVKLLRLEALAPGALSHFDAERRTLARLEHPNIARLLDGGMTPEGVPYLVMEFLDGLPIDRHCAVRGAGLDERLASFRTVCRAVQFAHANLVIHRDLKPGNILVDRQGTPKLLDFGIARLLEEGEAEARTQLQVYTPDYASPEQLRGEPLTTASDVWSLGIVLYELVTGRRPWDRRGLTPGEWERRVSEATAPRPSTVLRTAGDAEQATRSGVPNPRLARRVRGDLDRIIAKALQSDPSRRYLSAEQLADDLDRFATGHPVHARDDSVFYRARRFVGRNRLVVAAAVATGLALAFAAGASWRGQRRAEEALEVARAARIRAEAAATHARIEAESFQLFAAFLGDTFLGASLDDAARERLRTAIDRHADQVRRQHAGQTHLQANLLHALGDTAVRLGLLADGRALLEEAQALRIATYGEASLENALSLSSLGRLSLVTGDLPLAEALLTRALELHRRLPVDVHTAVAKAANDLAVVLRRSGSLRRARALHEEALALRLDAPGPRTLPAAESRHNLAHVLLDLGDTEAAEGHAVEALSIRREILGPDDPLTLQSAISVAGVALGRGDHDRAAALLREAERGYRALGPEGREGLFHAVANLAALHLAAQDIDRAAPLADEALALARERHGDDHLDVATAWSRVAAVALARGDLARAREGWSEVLRIRRSALPAHHRLLTIARVRAADVELRDERWAAAEALLRGALDGALGDRPDAELAATIRVRLAACVEALGRADEARTLLESALETLRARHGDDAAVTKDVAARLEALR